MFLWSTSAAVVIVLLSLTDGAPDNLQYKGNITAMDEVVEANTKQDSLTGRTQQAIDDDMFFPKTTSSAGSQDYSAAADARHKIWLNGKIYYKMSESITRRPNYVRVIKAAMAEWERDTCIRFINKTNSNDVEEYVHIYYGTGCRGSVGRWEGKRSLLSLGKSCDKFRIVLHELGHTIGYFHEQNRRDRDYYVEIIWRNINPRWTRSFYLRTKPIKIPSTPYDYYSIMHYGTHTYSINGKPTLRSRNPSVKYLGNTGLSLMDIKQTNIMYNCIDFPNFPEDFFFTKGEKEKTPANCVAMDEPEDPLWNTTNICYNQNKKELNIKWSKSGPVPSMSCTNTIMPDRQSYARFWEDNFLCVPRDSVLRFRWSISGPIRGMKCAGIKVYARSPYLYHLCAVRTDKTVTINEKILESNYTSWSSWRPCSKECGGGNQSRFRKCKNERICKEILVETRVCNKNKCSSWPHWPSDFQFYVGLSKIGSITTCINIYERNQYSQWLNHKFCWAITRRRKLKILWSDMNEVPGMRCTKVIEPREKRTSGWDNNYLCVQRDAPYRFQWSANGTINGLKCLKWMGKEGMNGWENNYLCADKYPAKYTSWSPWQPCSKTCGEGTHSRLRQCKKGQTCDERVNETRLCHVRKCQESTYSPWSAWQPCSKTCGNGTQSRQRQCKEGGACLERLEEAKSCNIQPCLDWPHWPYEFYFYVGPKPHLSVCVEIFERKQYSEWKNKWFCWRGMSRRKLNLLWIEQVYSRNGVMDEETGMHCTQITEPREKKDSGWDDNYLCVQRDAPYRFHWSSNGAIQGLYCIKWIGRNGKDGWDNNYLCANKSREANGSYYTPWSPWQPCSKTCGGGSQNRFRSCYTRICKEGLVETRVCNIHNCPGCPSKWKTWKTKSSHFCYHLVYDELTWQRAQTACEKRNANLLSLGSQEEFEFVRNNVQERRQSVWIGANDRKTEGEWQWTDGANFTFSKPWGHNEPSKGKAGYKENCAMMRPDGQWNDYPCAHSFYYICKKVPH